MTKNNIALKIAAETGLHQTQVKRIVQMTLDGMIDCIISEGSLEFRNFGIFKAKTLAPRKARNPKTGDKVMLPERKTVRFKPGKAMEERILRSGSADTTVIELAKRIASKAHAGQMRKDGVTPYIAHPETVAAAVPDEFKPIAWLHDVLEDTELTDEDLREQGIPDAVIEAVQALTKVDGESYEQYLDRVVANPAAARVKKADIAHNLSGQPSEKAKAKYAVALKRLAEAGIE